MRKTLAACGLLVMGVAAVAGTAGCGRSPISFLRHGPEPEPTPGDEPVDAAVGLDVGVDLPADRPADRPPDLAPDAPADAPSDLPIDRAPPPPPPPPPPATPPVPGCQPRGEEVCNNIDDDCDGKIDEDLVAVACPGGGSRYCVAGQLSACPQRCEVCLPGSRRVCLVPYCTFWGTQVCAGDGRSWSRCYELPAPSECLSVAKDKKRSAELEKCCIDNGFCCLDEFDLDGDGNREEMLGRCDSVKCGS